MSEPDHVALMRLVNAFQLSQAVHVAAVLKLADHLTRGSVTIDDLAAKTETHPESLYRLMRMLAAAGVFKEEEGRRFSLTGVGACLRSNAPIPVAPWAEQIGQPNYWQAWGDLLHSVRTGESAFHHVHGMDVWDYRAQHPEAGKMFDTAMASLTRQVINPILDAYDFSGFRTFVDVGGGRGAVLTALLATYPHMQGVLFDLPKVVAEAKTVYWPGDIANRCVLEGGDFFVSVPKNADAYLFKAILHDWDDEDSLRILKTCRAAMPSSSKLLIVEYLVGAPNENLAAKMIDVNMLTIQQGRVRTEQQLAELLSESGFHLRAIKHTATALNIVEADPA